jgi:predicted adenylyl cyclase CyaB
MAKEIEVKILNVDPVKLKKQLSVLGAKHVKNVLQRNEIFKSDAHPNVMLRLRYETTLDEKKEKKIIFTTKGDRKIVNGLANVDEYECTIQDVAPFKGMFKLLGFKLKHIRELRRDYYQLEGCTVEICEVPTIPIFIELEGTEQSIAKVAQLLGYSKKSFDARGLYKIYPDAAKNLVFKK